MTEKDEVPDDFLLGNVFPVAMLACILFAILIAIPRPQSSLAFTAVGALMFCIGRYADQERK
jgi:hypothetical protein